MRVVIAGPRDFFPSSYQFNLIVKKLESLGIEVKEVVSGTANGVDKAGENWGFVNRRSVKRFPANWDQYGKAAGPIRSGEMADYAAAVVVIVNRDIALTKGSKNMTEQGAQKKLPVLLARVYEGEDPSKIDYQLLGNWQKSLL